VVEERNRTGAHCEDVAEDPADASRRSLERLDRRRVVVALHLERHREPVSDVEHAGVLARSLHDALSLRGEPLQQPRRVLVPAVLRPEEREDGELELVRGASEEGADTVGLLVRQAEGAMQREIRGAAQAASLSAAPGDPDRGCYGRDP